MTEPSLPNITPKCQWKLNSQKKSPHNHRTYEKKNGIQDSILDSVGWTPLVRLNKIPQKHGLKCEVLVKCEYFSAGGSVKDRIALRMIEEAEASGLLKKGSTIIEPTSGNTGIGLALAAAVKGYRCVIVLPEKMSKEKVDTLHALGAEIVRTPTAAAWNDDDSHISVANRLLKEIPNSVILNQYINPYNPIAHYDQTAEEILKQCDGQVDMIVLGAGTGGTVSGIGRKIKEKLPNCKIVGVDPVGSILSGPLKENDDVTFYDVEGIGYDFIPTVLNRSIVDKWIKTRDLESFRMARQLIRDEGILCGGSSGTAVYAAMEAAQNLAAGKRVVVVLPDGLRNYMTKFLSDQWMVRRHFMEPVEAGHKEAWWTYRVASEIPVREPVTFRCGDVVFEAIDLMKKENVSQVLLTSGEGDEKKVYAYLSSKALVNKLTLSNARPLEGDMPVRMSLADKCLYVKGDMQLSKLSYLLQDTHFVVLVNDNADPDIPLLKDVKGVITSGDLLHFVMDKRRSTTDTNGQQ